MPIRFIGFILLPGFVFRLLGRRDGKHSPKTVSFRISGFEERCRTLVNYAMLLSEMRTRDAVQKTVDALFLYRVSAAEPAANTIRRKQQAASMLGDALKLVKREKRRLISVTGTFFRKYKNIATQYLIGVSCFMEEPPALSEWSSYFSNEEYLCEAGCEQLFGFIEKSASVLLNVPEVSVKGRERSA